MSSSTQAVLEHHLWEANPWFPLGTDTFVVREGKIAFQTFAAYAKPE